MGHHILRRRGMPLEGHQVEKLIDIMDVVQVEEERAFTHTVSYDGDGNLVEHVTGWYLDEQGQRRTVDYYQRIHRC